MAIYSRYTNIIAVPVAFVLLLTGCGDSSDYVATVDGEKILQTELDQALREQYGAEVLDTLINNKIIALEAEKEGITILDNAIQAEYDELVESYGGKAALQEALDANGLTVESVKDNIRMYQLTKDVMAKSIDISDEELQQYFEEHKDDYGQQEQVAASHIFLEDEATAKEVEEKLKAGEDFAELAKAYSVDTDTREDGGDLGYIQRGQMDEQFEAAAFALEKGAVSSVVQSVEGYHIIKVTGKEPAQQAVFEDVQDEVYETVLESRINEEYMTWLTTKQEQYKIEKQ
ncbi:peptidylprolyl isomerase [Lysinibacillus sp. C5.1]|uniref:peptidylprolyl isomerase n=1 Tax=Lysinibacillus sp. C5.1 TaxID=2796169 RepID=UPI0030813D1C